MDSKTFLNQIIIAIIATLGGIARYLNDYMNGAKFVLLMFVVNAIVSCFTGLIFGLLATGWGLDQHYVWAISGIGGSWGFHGIVFLRQVIAAQVKLPR